jgi:hypothetical protein
MKKIIIIHVTPLLERLRNGFLIDTYIESGFEFEYWDLHSVLENFTSYPEELTHSYVFKFNSLSEAENRLVKIDKKNTIFILAFDFIWRFRHLFHLLVRHNCYMVRIDIYPNPFSFNQISFNKYSLQYIFSFHSLKMFTKYFKTTMYHLLNSQKQNKIFKNYFACIASDFRTNKINSADYEIYKSIKNDASRIIEDKYMVFLDISYSSHPETISLSKNSLSIAKDYQKSMRKFFDWLEQKFQIPVVIAAHPSSTYENLEFGNRRIIKNQTARLVKDADYVLTHLSTTTVLAILFDKPILFIKTNKMNIHAGFSLKISLLANYVGKKAYNIDKVNFDEIEFTKLDRSIREKYIYSHITSKETENKSNKDIILSEFNNIFDKSEFS